ncbi:MAG: glycosyltransferase family 2 protein [Betaproteobacteria bacterium]
MGDKSVSVVVPALNEAENIRPLVNEILAALGDDPDLEIVYVDDGSDDESPAIFAALAEELAPRFKCIRHRQRCGQSTGVSTGVRHARNRWIATIDADGQNDPANIPVMLAKLFESADPQLRLVAGWRQKRKDTWLKRISSRIANRVRSGFLKDSTPDTGCGLKVFSRDLFLRLPYFDHMHRFLPALVLRAGGEVVSVPVNHRPRVQGVSKYGFHNRLWVGIVDLFGVAWLQRRAKVPAIESISGGER